MTAKNVTTTIKENTFYIWFTVAILVTLCPILAYGLSFIIPFWKAYALTATTVLPAIIWAKVRTDNEENAETFLKKELSTTEEQLNASWKQIEEVEVVLKDYEEIYDSQLWEIPCNCGENTFVGLFSPYAENIVGCDKCKNKYRITLNYEAVLLSEPLDNDSIFNSLKTKLDSTQASPKNSANDFYDDFDDYVDPPMFKN